MEILPGVHRIASLVSTAYLLVDNSAGLTLIDTGPARFNHTIEHYLANIGRRPSEIRRIILTHRHFDHMGSAAKLRAATGAPVFAHPLDAPQITGAERNRLPKGILGAGMALVQPWMFPIEPCPVDIEIDDGQVLGLGDLGEMRVVLTPGHTLGHCSLWLPSRRLLILGDALMNLGRTPRVSFDAVNDDTAQARRTAVMLGDFAGEIDALVFGHGAPIVVNGGQALRNASAAASKTLLR
jgi:glyoxylase-like metal-dependent hydrolase (beta-lactamase superfamily II)